MELFGALNRRTNRADVARTLSFTRLERRTSLM
jgi:hypothetical protein